MRVVFILIFSIALITGCSSGNEDPFSTPVNQTDTSAKTIQSDLSWGYYDLFIDTNDLRVDLTPQRDAMAPKVWPYHLNVTKLLEASPCTDCLAVSNVHKLPNGDLSMDVEITHPYKDRRFTGFDVKGIIMFEASQKVPDNDLLAQAGLDPIFPKYNYSYSSWEKGDPELMNPDGWTMIWSPVYNPAGIFGDQRYFGLPDSGFPIFEYYEGKYASELDNVGKLNAYRRFYSKEERHIFEVNTTVSRTYIIRPPADGSPIKAKYAIYAHWCPPSVLPVNNPVTDFPPEANSSIPYEFYITQTAPIDPDKSGKDEALKLKWHIKVWNIPNSHWYPRIDDLLLIGYGGGLLLKHPSGEPDTYKNGGFESDGYLKLPGAIPGDLTFVFMVGVKHPEDQPWFDGPKIGTDWHITKIAIEAPDGQ